MGEGPAVVESGSDVDGDATHTAPAPARRRASPGNLLRLAFVLVAVGLGTYAVASEWTQVRAGIDKLGFPAVGGAFAADVLGIGASMLMWRALMAAFGSPLPPAAAARVFFVGQLGKYVPGSVWPVLAQMELGRDYHVPPRRSATVAILAMLTGLASGLLAAAVALSLLSGRGTSGYRWAYLVAPVVLVFLHPRILNPLMNRLLRLARRPELEQPLTLRALGVAMAWGLAQWVCFGAQIWLLVVDLGAPAGRAVPAAIGGFAFAWSVGFLVVIAPAGAGVRDAILIAVLGGVLTNTADATVVALLSRILMTAGDLLLAAVGVWTGRRTRRMSHTT